MTIIHNDFETFSPLSLPDVGIDNYAKCPQTGISMWAYAFDDGVPKLWEPPDPFPKEVMEAIKDPHVIKAAWNAGFERTIFFHKLGIWIDYNQWIDPMVNARYFSLPGSLEEVGEILKIPVHLRKIADGDRLKKLFSEPQPVKKARKQASDENTLFPISPVAPAEVVYDFANRTTHPEDWVKYGEYCKQDVVAERAIGTWLSHKQCAPMPEREMKLWYLDQAINVYGMPTDRKFVQNSLALAIKDKELLAEKQKKLTGLENPNSNSQMLVWAQNQGYPRNSLRKESVTSVLGDPDVKLTPLCREVLTLRKLSAKTSYTKLAAILDALSSDDQLRDQFMFMGSSRCGRWSGKQVQLHNMARPIKALEKEGALDIARDLIYAEDFNGIQEAFSWVDDKGKTHLGSVIDVVTSCIRSAFVAHKGQRFNVCDLNAIENRVLGWITGEDKILEVFRNGRCPYLSFASLMYNIPYDILKARYDAKDPDAKEMRQIAKSAVLGAGYRLSGGQWGTNRYGDRIQTGLWGYSKNMGVEMSQEVAAEAVKAFRKEYHKVVQAWYEYEDAVLRCLKGQGPQPMCSNGPKDPVYGCQLEGNVRHHLIWCDRRKRKDGQFILRIHLPSGRCLHYVNAFVTTKEFPGRDGTPYSKETMCYEGINQETKQWEAILTHGGKICENIDQAISRDVLAEAMLRISEMKGVQICAHVHDEIVSVSDDTEDAPGLVDLKAWMSSTPVWAPGLPLAADGYEDSYYHK